MPIYCSCAGDFTLMIQTKVCAAPVGALAPPCSLGNDGQESSKPRPLLAQPLLPCARWLLMSCPLPGCPAQLLPHALSTDAAVLSLLLWAAARPPLLTAPSAPAGLRGADQRLPQHCPALQHGPPARDHRVAAAAQPAAPVMTEQPPSPLPWAPGAGGSLSPPPQQLLPLAVGTRQPCSLAFLLPAQRPWSVTEAKVPAWPCWRL